MTGRPRGVTGSESKRNNLVFKGKNNKITSVEENTVCFAITEVDSVNQVIHMKKVRVYKFILQLIGTDLDLVQHWVSAH